VADAVVVGAGADEPPDNIREKRSVNDCCEEDWGSLAADPKAPLEDEQPALSRPSAHTHAAGTAQFQ
jgi:hypothetical protein